MTISIPHELHLVYDLYAYHSAGEKVNRRGEETGQSYRLRFLRSVDI